MIRSRKAAGCVILLTLILFASAGLIGLAASNTAQQLSPNQPTYAALAAAEEQWARNPIQHYQLQVRLMQVQPISMCSYTIVVEAEVIREIKDSSCTFRPLTVMQLFGWIRGTLQRYDGECAANGCKCNGPLGIAAAFDSQHGYPYYARVHTMPALAVKYRRLIDTIPGFEPVCTTKGLIYPQLEQVELIALAEQ